METVRTTLFLPKNIHGFLKDLSVKKQTSMAKLIQMAVNQVFLEPHRKTAKDLWGSVDNTRISESEFSKLKSRLNP